MDLESFPGCKPGKFKGVFTIESTLKEPNPDLEWTKSPILFPFTLSLSLRDNSDPLLVHLKTVSTLGSFKGSENRLLDFGFISKHSK